MATLGSKTQSGSADLASVAASSHQTQVPFGTVFTLVWLSLMFEYVRPQVMAQVPLFGLPTLIGLCTGVYWLGKGDKSVLKDPLLLGYIAFIMVMIVSLAATVNQYWWFQHTRNVIMYLIAVVLPGVAFLANPSQVSRLLKAFVLFNVVLAIWVMTHAGKGPTGPMADENDACLALVVALPYAWFLSQSPRNTAKQKMMFLGAAVVILLGIVATASRGGFVGLAVVALSIFFLSPNKMRNLFIGLLLGLVMLWQAPDTFWKEMGTITDTKEETADERLFTWRRGLEMWADHPFLGVGAGNFPWRLAEYKLKSREHDPMERRVLGGRQAHSIYLTVLPELGIIGTTVFVALIWNIVRKLRKTAGTARKYRSDPICEELFLLNRAVMMSLLGFLSAGAFISVLYYPHLWYLIGFALMVEHALALAMQGVSADAGSSPESTRRAAKGRRLGVALKSQ